MYIGVIFATDQKIFYSFGVRSRGLLGDKMRREKWLVFFLMALCVAANAEAQITIGPYEFAGVGSFATGATMSNGSTCAGGAAFPNSSGKDCPDSVIGHSPNDCIANLNTFSTPVIPGQGELCETDDYVEFEFGTTPITNVVGPDLVIFDTRLSTDGVGLAVETAPGVFSDFEIWLPEEQIDFAFGTGCLGRLTANPIDLSRFGLVLGTTVSKVRVVAVVNANDKCEMDLTMAGVPQSLTCTTDDDCFDGEPCTIDTCGTGGACSYTPDTVDPLCPSCASDADCGGTLPVCDTMQGQCVECLSDNECDDSNECTTDTCASKKCSNTPKAEGTACSGGFCDAEAVPECVGCVDSENGDAVDSGCSSAAPLCIDVMGSPMCVACADSTNGGTDLGCASSPAGPVCEATNPSNPLCVSCEDNMASGMDNGCDDVNAPLCLVPGGGAALSCVECIDDADCSAGNERCGLDNTCAIRCASSSECTDADRPVCDTDAELCVECLVDTECTGVQTCSMNRSCRPLDSDEDGVPDSDDLDDDNDGVPDTDENGGDDPSEDSDTDSIPDYIDESVTGCTPATNGICDTVPSASDFDGDGIANHLDRDADGDGLLDLLEGGGVDGDEDGIVDMFSDLNGNGLHDALETSPLPLPNTDSEDGPDFLDADDDGDGILTIFEAPDANDNGAPDDARDTDDDTTPDYLDADDDDDGVATIDENPDPNGDGNPDDAVDSDGDSVPDYLQAGDASIGQRGLAGGSIGCSLGQTQLSPWPQILISLVLVVTLRRRRRKESY